MGGTGPFIITQYIEGSQATYERNPNYWGTTTINGKEYQVPFIDKLIYPIIPDESTQIAALRTGQLDMWPKVSLVYQDNLAQTCPELIRVKYLSNRIEILRLNAIHGGTFSNRDIRRALMIATDLKAMRDTLFIEGDIDGCPQARGTAAYTPIEELPESTRILYDYNPALARQMIADEGYPDGFKCEIEVLNTALDQDIGAMLVDMWAKAGIEASVKVLDQAAWAASGESVLYKDMILRILGCGNPWGPFTQTLSTLSKCHYRDPYYDEQYALALATIDPVERAAILKKLAIYRVDNVIQLGLGNPYVLNCYWPWIKNYYNEIDVGYMDFIPMIRTLWIDQDLKAEMGYWVAVATAERALASPAIRISSQKQKGANLPPPFLTI